MGPFEFATLIRVQIVKGRWPWAVASDGDRVFLTDHDDPRVVEARLWEGVAQCLLTRRGVPWSAEQAQEFGAFMRCNSPTLH